MKNLLTVAQAATTLGVTEEAFRRVGGKAGLIDSKDKVAPDELRRFAQLQANGGHVRTCTRPELKQELAIDGTAINAHVDAGRLWELSGSRGGVLYLVGQVAQLVPTTPSAPSPRPPVGNNVLEVHADKSGKPASFKIVEDAAGTTLVANVARATVQGRRMVTGTSHITSPGHKTDDHRLRDVGTGL